ncbi:MAG TPA: glycosyltransferase, partial [Gemmatimonadaceae bacterium]|nr:glycosyltransferase [Gemmatimonadaceae bacterium]
MKIALATDWFAPRQGGIETQLVGLARGLGARGHQVDVITATPGARDDTYFRVRMVRSGSVPGLDLAMSPRLPAELRA